MSRLIISKRMALKSTGPQTNTSYSDLCEDNKAFVEIASYDCWGGIIEYVNVCTGSSGRRFQKWPNKTGEANILIICPFWINNPPCFFFFLFFFFFFSPVSLTCNFFTFKDGSIKMWGVCESPLAIFSPSVNFCKRIYGAYSNWIKNLSLWHVIQEKMKLSINRGISC